MLMNPLPMERRRHIRRPIHSKELATLKLDQPVVARIVDLCMGGMALEFNAAKNILPGTRCRLDFFFSDDLFLRDVSTIIRWTASETGGKDAPRLVRLCGIEFAELSFLQQSLIYYILQRS